MNKTATKLFATLMLTAMVLSVVPLFNMAKAVPPAPCMYLIPDFPTFSDDTTPLYSTFTETLWIATTVNIFTYQFEVDWNTAQLNLTSIAWTAGSKSQFFSPMVTIPGGPNIYPLTGKCSGGESLTGSDVRAPGSGTLVTLTFNITASPPMGGSLTSLITVNPAQSFMLDHDLNTIQGVSFGNAVYTYNWTPPGPAHIDVEPAARTYAKELLWNGTVFQEDIVIKGLAAGWHAFNVTTQLDYNNVLTCVDHVTPGPAWTYFDWSGNNTGTLTFFGNTTSLIPLSGDVLIASVFFRIIGQGSVPPEIYGTFKSSVITPHGYSVGSTAGIYVTLTSAIGATVIVYNYAPTTPPYLSVSSAVLGPTPSLGEEFNITVSLNNVRDFEDIIGVMFRMNFDPTMVYPVACYEGPFLGSYAALQPGSMGTWYVQYINDPDGAYGPHVIVGNMIFPNSTGMWNEPMLNGSGVVATITFRLNYQSFGEPDLVYPLKICDKELVGLDNLIDQNVVDKVMDDSQNGTVTITTNWPGRMIDLYGGAVNSGLIKLDNQTIPQFVPPYGGQGPNAPMDLVEPQSWVYLNANVTYNYWPVQHKNVAFEIQEPDGTVYNKLSTFTDSNGVASVGFRMPWPCVDPESLFGVWHITATVQLADVVINDTMNYHYDYLVHVWKVTTDKFQYNHDECVHITFTYGSHAQQFYPVLFVVSIVDNLGVTVGIATVSTQVGGTVYCQYKNFTQQVTICLPKWAYAGIATIHINTFNIEPALGGVALSPEYIGPTIAIQPY